MMPKAIPTETWRAFGLALLGLTFANLDHSLFALVLTEIKRDFGWSDAQRGWYLFWTFVVAGLIVTQIGVLADRVGRKAVLIGSMIITPLLVTGMYWVHATWLLLVLRTLSFAAAGAQSPITGTLMVEESPPRLRGLFSGVLQIGYPLGWALAALILIPLVYRGEGNWRAVFLLSLIGLPIALLFMWRLREPPAWQQARRADAKPVATTELFRPEFRYRTAWLFLGQFLHVFAYGATVLLAAYFEESRGFTKADTLMLVGVSYLVGSLGYVTAAWVGEFYLSRRNVVILWCWLGAIALAAMVWIAGSWWSTVVWFGLTTFFFYGATAVIFAFLAENFPARVRATATSFSGALAVNLGIACGPLALSLLIAPLGWQWGFTICGVVPLVLAGCAYLFLQPVVQNQAVDAVASTVGS